MAFNSSVADFRFCTTVVDSKTAHILSTRVDTLAILSLISPILSIIGSGSVIIFVAYHRICRSPDINSLFHLSIADFLLAVLWIVGPIVHLKYHLEIASSRNLARFCVTLQALCEMVHIMSFFLTINYAFHVFLRMKEKKDRLYANSMDDDLMTSQQRSKYLAMMKAASYIFSWLIPAILIMPLLVLVLQQDYFCQMCIILIDAPLPARQNSLEFYNGFVLMIVTLGFSMIVIIILYICTLRMYKKTLLGFHTNRERVVIHAMAKRATAYVLVFIYCWTPALVLSDLGLKNAYDDENSDSGLPLYYKYYGVFIVQTLTAPLQGFLNSLVYGWTRKTFREAFARETRQWLNYGSIDSQSSTLLASTDSYDPH